MATGASIAGCISRLHYGLVHHDARGADDVLQNSPDEDTNVEFLLTKIEVELRDIKRREAKISGSGKGGSSVRQKGGDGQVVGTLDRSGVATMSLPSGGVGGAGGGGASSLSFRLEPPRADDVKACGGSMLTRQIPLGSAPEMAAAPMTPEEASANKVKAVARGQDMTVFFTMYHKVLKGKRLDPKGPNSLRLRAARNVAIGRFVEFALQRYNLELDRSGVAADDKTRAQPAAAAWIIKMAEDNGEPDEDMQMDISPGDPLEKYGISQLTLIPNPMYRGEPGGRSDLRKSGTFGGSSPSQRPGRAGSVLSQGGSPSGGGGGGGGSDSGVVRVNLPTLAGGQYVVVPYTTDMLVEALIDAVCRKRQMGASFAYELRNGKDQVIDCGNGQRMGALGKEVLQDLHLCTKSVTASSEKSARSAADAGPMNIGGRLFFTESTASQYTEYRVIKVNKHGKRQERVMGIERDRISNKNDAKAKRGLFNRTKVKNPERSITDVTAVELIRGDVPSFMITYKADGKYVFEAQNQEEAAEIVAKIKFLVDLKR